MNGAGTQRAFLNENSQLVDKLEKRGLGKRWVDWLSNMNIGLKINAMLISVGLAPALGALLFLNQGQPEKFHNILALYITAFVILVYPFSKFMEELIVLRQTRKINRYVDEVKVGRYTMGLNLPEEKGNEHDFLQLQRNIYWMVQGLMSREAKLENALQTLDQARRQIVESIEYASLIQRSFLPSALQLERALEDHFLLWLPRDGVGGDAYWQKTTKDVTMIAVYDCTGHGVPGAFLTLIANSLFEQNCDDSCQTNPAKLLGRMSLSIRAALYQHNHGSLAEDGMEGSLCCIDWNQGLLYYAGAKGRMLLAGEDGVREVRGNRHGVGFANEGKNASFTNQVIDLKEHHTIYLYTDGITDQAGGEKGLPFGHTRLRRWVENTCQFPLPEQKDHLEQTFQKYKGRHTQRDDLTVLGFSTRKRGHVERIT